MKKLLLLLPLAALAGCSLNRTAARVTAGVVDKGLPAVFSQSDPQYVREALPANLQLMEILLASDPGNKAMLVNASQGFCGYAFMFLEDETPERASVFYLKGQAYAERALDGATVETARKKDAHPLFWHTFCKALYMNINRDNPEAIAEIPTLEPAALKLLELDPGYYYNAAEDILGAYHAIRPRMLGGSPEKAAEHFELALKGAGANFHLSRYLYAKMAAVAAQDGELFDRLLNEIISAEPVEGETRLANEVARIKAKKLLEKKDELF
ncbi:MAG: hypothetical protein A2X31_03325 [Elusimicrobia bacterium GWB2_63_22]|nr:MAG: hypothetical protein A2X31_03325 [Elusimicrobia bacterium GWB2_63_22]